MKTYIAHDSRGRPLVRLLAEDYASAVLYAFRGGVPGASTVIGDGDDAGADMKAAESRLVASFRAGGLSEAEARVAARGRERDLPTRDILRTIRVPPQSATTRSSSTATHISERDSYERGRESLELREPTWTNREFDELAELVELGTITEAGQELGASPSPAFAQLLPYADGTAQWRIPTCPLCAQRHFIPEQPTTDDLQAIVGEPMAMPCRRGVAVLTDAATTNSPPDSAELHAIATKTEVARAEADLVDAFRAGGLSEAEARVAARGRNRR